jgi:serine/threonine-protein kinase
MESLGGFRKRVALKVLNPELTNWSDASKRLRDEARVLGLLKHRNIVAVDDLVRLDGRWAVVMEHIEGLDLEVLADGLRSLGSRVPARNAIEICGRIAAALDAAFNGTSSGDALRVVHRDIKPSNVRMTPEGEVKVLDFGIARADLSGREAKTGRVRYGSVGYMSPERLLGDPEVPAGDVFALGSILVELLQGMPLGRCELAPEAHGDQVDAAVGRALGNLPEECSAEDRAALEALIRSTLAYAPDQRPSARQVAQRCNELAPRFPGDELAVWASVMVEQVQAALPDTSEPAGGTLTEEATTAKPTVSNPTLVLEDLTAEPEPEPIDEPAEQAPPPPVSEPEPPPSKGPMWIGMALALALVAGVGWWAWDKSQTPEPVGTPTDIGPAPQDVPEPVADPVVEPPPEPEVAQPDPAPVIPDPAKAKVTRDPVERPPAERAPAAQDPAPAVAADVVRLRSAKFTVPNAASVKATCGDTSGNGPSSVLLRDVPAGVCVIEAQVDGASLRGTFSLTAPAGVTCTPGAGGALSCS